MQIIDNKVIKRVLCIVTDITMLRIRIVLLIKTGAIKLRIKLNS